MAQTPAQLTEAKKRRRLLRTIFAIAGEAGINDRSDRIELAKALFDLGEGGDLESYNDLPTEDLEDILFALRAWRHIQLLRFSNGTLESEAWIVLRSSGALPESAAPHDPR